MDKQSENRIYAFVTDSDPKYVKFGVSVNPKTRLWRIACGCPFRVELVGHVRGSYDDEKKIHLALWKNHQHGEWFICEGDAEVAMEYIKSGDVASLGKLISELFHDRMRSNIPFKRKLQEIVNCA